MVHISSSWCGLHAIVVHFPLVLLLIAPLFVVVGLGLPSAKGRPFLVSALAFLLLGTATVLVAAATGEAGMKAVNPAPAARVALEQHRRLGETTVELFAVLTLAYAAVLFVPKLSGHEPESWVNTALLAIFLVFYATGALFLVNTFHHGGLVVHELGHSAPVTVAVPVKEARQ